MTGDELKERLALTFIKGMTAELARKIVEVFGDLHSFFEFDRREIRNIEEAGPAIWELFDARPAALRDAANELTFVNKHKIRVASVVDEQTYPRRLYNCPDAPVNLFVLGNADLDCERVLAVVGTRHATPYGLTYTSNIIEELYDCVGKTTIVSGLAYGIDKASHETALRLDIPTVAVMAHGLGMVYPALHRGLATDILKHGGAIVSEYPHDAKPFRGRFLERNRIVAGLSDAVFVAESPVKGGALNTAAHARHYNREVLALPGRASDEASRGCNKMISRQLAVLATTGREIAYAACWDIDKQAGRSDEQPSLFDAYTGTVKTLYDFLKEQLEPCTLDRIVSLTGINAKDAMSALGELDLDGLLVRHPGARFALV